VFFVVLSLLLMFVDARYRYLESARSTLSMLVTPVQKLATMPGKLWHQAGEFFVTQGGLVEENHGLRQQHGRDAALLSQLQSLQQENQHLRNLLALAQRGEFSAQSVEILYAERDIFKRKLLIGKGEDARVKLGQVVMDDMGIVGQITRVYPWMSEVTLITRRTMPCRCRWCATACAPSCSVRETPVSCRCVTCGQFRYSERRCAGHLGH